MTVRRATAADADELIRLRAVMFGGMPVPMEGDGEWREAVRHVIVTTLDEPAPGMAAFVADRPGGGLAACAVGIIQQRLGSPRNPSGLNGYILNVVTDADQRRRGHSRACMTALLDWFRSRGVGVVDLRASPDGEPLYADLGFRRTPDPAMRLVL
jgi:GNAT superfamily N-acetyltransferase